MKRNFQRSILILMLMLVFVLPVSASSATSRTRTLNAKYEIVWTQDAYLPKRTITNLGLKSPQDSVFD
jgi:hypothetical protein